MLYEFDNSCMFTFRVANILFFAYTSDVDYELGHVRYLVVATDGVEIKELKIGDIPVFQVLDKQFLWMVDRDFDGKHLATEFLAEGIYSVPELHRPMADTFLFHKQPAIKSSALTEIYRLKDSKAYLKKIRINRRQKIGLEIEEVQSDSYGRHSMAALSIEPVTEFRLTPDGSETDKSDGINPISREAMRAYVAAYSNKQLH